MMKDDRTSEHYFNSSLKNRRSLRKRPCQKPVRNRAACILCGYDGIDGSYHRFPTDNTKSEWLRICELSEKTNPKNLRICGRHFREDEKLRTYDGLTYLKEGTIPTLNLEICGLQSDKNEYRVATNPLAKKLHNTVESDSSQITSSASYSELGTANVFESDLDLKNKSNVELIEVVEMKIYRFNSTPSIEIPHSSNNISADDKGTTSVNQMDDESDTSAHIRGLEMHSYSKKAVEETPVELTEEPISIKRPKVLRYFGDLTEDDYASPESAKLCWDVARKVIETKRMKILRYTEQNEILKRKMKNLKDVIRQLRMKQCVPAKYIKQWKDM